MMVGLFLMYLNVLATALLVVGVPAAPAAHSPSALTLSSSESLPSPPSALESLASSSFSARLDNSSSLCLFVEKNGRN